MQEGLHAPFIPIRDEDRELVLSINAYVKSYMSQPGHDNSHDYLHILRVVSNTNRILQAELQNNATVAYDTSALFLAALLHDVGDHKYTKPGEDLANQISSILRERGSSDILALKVQAIVENVGYTNEKNNPREMTEALSKHPELAIVQDADRLDAIGAVGVARCFSFGAAKFPDQPMSRAIEHFEEKLYKLADMMKTDTGRKMATKRAEVLRDFARHFNEEAELSCTLE